MALPSSFLKAGFVTPEQARHAPGSKFRRLMIATEGRSDTGKTEFLLTAPGPGLIVALDRGFDAMCDNPTPPISRRDDFGLMVIKAPTATQSNDPKWYQPYWFDFYKKTMDAITIPEARSLCIDGDNVSWDLQRLAEHGKLTGVATNMMTDEYKTVLDADGLPVIDTKTGEAKRERTGDSVARGFPDQEYLWQIRIRHLYKPPAFNTILKRSSAPVWGLRIVKCKANPTLVGEELWGADATFSGLVQIVYPHIPLSEWGL